MTSNTFNIATIGHSDHGKTTLTSAITKIICNLKISKDNKFFNNKEINNLP